MRVVLAIHVEHNTDSVKTRLQSQPHQVQKTLSIEHWYTFVSWSIDLYHCQYWCTTLDGHYGWFDRGVCFCTFSAILSKLLMRVHQRESIEYFSYHLGSQMWFQYWFFQLRDIFINALVRGATYLSCIFSYKWWDHEYEEDFSLITTFLKICV